MGVNIKKEFGNTRNRKPDISTLFYGKIPPQAVEVESAVLGAIMLEHGALEAALSIITEAESFYNPSHQKIYAAAMSAYKQGSPVDLLTITEQLRKTDELELVGGAHYLTNLTMNVVTSGHIEAHSRIIMEKYVQRELIRISGECISEAYEDSTDVFDLQLKTEKAISTAGGISQSGFPQHVSKIGISVIRELHERRESGVIFSGVPTGYAPLDKLTSGWQKTDLIILAARPAVGKTALTISLMHNAATSTIKPCTILMFSHEMSKEQLVKRQLSMISGVQAYKIFHRPDLMTAEELQKVEQAAESLKNCRFFIEDSATATPLTIKRKARDIQRKFGLHCIAVDYMGLLDSDDDKKGTRNDQQSSVSRGLKKVAKELEVPLIALCQLSRDGGKAKPQLHHLRDSGGIEQDADAVMFLYAEDETTPEIVTLEFAKHRNGACDKLLFTFEKEYQRYRLANEIDFTPPPNPYAGIRGKHDTEPFY